ncbi:photosynthetic complex putative assembly protein PuhB [Elioraea rosea]|uniref:photosynthetic complex putative assembly protein PuhB n=1 Tax=Elioraea rosea TaxID=2492390 RepID=UPI0013159727|nr:photosynthetic complex putative assembly protein PuhB [Elioraea rosea]
MREHDFEPVPGLPERLPPGETILWQGAPRRDSLARRALHVRTIAIYFALLAAWRGIALAMDGAAATEIALGVALLVVLGGAAILPLALYAWASARTTLYTVTNRRVVIRAGVALPTTVNVPYASVEAAGLKQHSDGTGDIALRLAPSEKIAFLFLWPHARPWHFSRPQPTLRCIAEPETVAQIIGRALAASAALPVQAVPGTEHRSPARGEAAAATI